MFGAKRRAEQTVSREMSALRFERNEACARERQVREKHDTLEREYLHLGQKLATVTAVAGEMAQQRIAVQKDLEVTQARLRTAMTLLEAVRSVPELVLTLANEGRDVPIMYERAEIKGYTSEVQSLTAARGILLGMKAARAIADARSNLLFERVQAFRDVQDADEEAVTVLTLEGEDTRKVRMQNTKDA